MTTVRSDTKAKQLLDDYPEYSDKLSITIVEDVSKPGAFDHAVQSHPPFDAVLHTASPFHYHAKDPKKDMIDPAIHGTMEILQAVKLYAPSVERVVVTSSFAAVMNMTEPVSRYTESNWNPISEEQALTSGLATYVGSKTFAERAAWEFMEKEKPKFTLSTINPVVVFGPVTNLQSLANVNTSNQVFADIIQGKFKSTIEPDAFKWVDVRDVALAHVRVIELPQSLTAGRRFLACAGSYSNHEITSIIKNNFPELADKVPDRIEIPANPITYEIDTSGVNQTLGIPFRSLEESVIDIVKSLLKVPS